MAETKKSFAQKSKEQMTCYCCGKKGHAAPDCDKKDKIPREEWYIKKAMSNMQSQIGTESDGDSGKRKAWSGFQHDFE
jgi:hypothetical protein